VDKKRMKGVEEMEEKMVEEGNGEACKQTRVVSGAVEAEAITRLSDAPSQSGLL
jgi:hypothetical protein